ncbi:MBL fold metallo-hydrolase [Mesorhizobium sp. USDA-HM6]|nr:MBL fold metallo-hydrolase [Mesorhizobium sp. USDA-HM6]
MNGCDLSNQSDWFVAESVSDRILRIWEPYVHPFFRANLFHVVGRDADLVIDFGMGLKSLRRFLHIKAGKPVIAVASHAHVDHVGSFHEFEHRLGHATEAEAFATMTDASTLADLFRNQPEAVCPRPHPSWAPQKYVIAPAPLTEVLTEDARIETGDASYRTLHLPGHSPGSIGLLDEQNGVLFSGDAIYDGSLVDDLPGCDKVEYRKTMERLLTLEVDVAYGGHGSPMSRQRMRSIAEGYLESAVPE